MNKEGLEYNKRQIDIIEKKLQDYLKNKIYIDWLIKDLEALIKSMIDLPQEYLEEFSILINELELYYADVLYEKRTNFNYEEKIEVSKVIKSIQTVIEKYKKEYL